MVQIDGAGRGGLVDPGVACWVGISGELGAREERGMSAWQFAVMKPAVSSPSIEAFSAPSQFMSLRESWGKWHESRKYDILKWLM